MSAPLLPPPAPERQNAGSPDRRRGFGEPRPLNVHAVHLRLSILPAALMACLGLIAVTVLILAGPVAPGAWPALLGIAGGAVAVMCVTVIAADRATQRERQLSSRPRDADPRLGDLAALVSHGRHELHGLAERIAAGQVPVRRSAEFRPASPGDPVVHLAHELQAAQVEAWNAVINAASRAPGSRTAQRVEVFVNLALRMQSLSHRALRGLDELENQVEDPELLKGLFRVDHLSTRLRRQAESLAVIGGAVSRRQWSRPVATYEIVRSAIAEVEHYSRVKVVPPVEGALDGGAAADVIHLLAELVENATKFSPPHTQVLVRAEAVTAGLAIEIEDRGLGIPRETRLRLNDVLAAPERIDVDELVNDGRIGLLVVSALSRRHKVVVRLQTNVYGGTQAVVVIPNELIGSETRVRQVTSPERAEPAPAPSPPSATPAASSATSADTAGSRVSPVPSSGSGPDSPVPGDHDAGARPGGPPEAAWTEPSADTPARRTDDPTGPGPAVPGQRPELPKRRPQANLASELRGSPAPTDDDADVDLDHGLMASFMKGMHSGQDEDVKDGTGNAGH
ncbi:MAG TPA: ATP-binding protein [Nonomuraea sp.]|nr:ATP-binding protein [Nonomuraea sp.]